HEAQAAPERGRGGIDPRWMTMEDRLEPASERELLVAHEIAARGLRERPQDRDRERRRAAEPGPGRECGPYLDHEPPWREPECRGGILDETERPLVAPKLPVVARHPCRPLCRAHLHLEPEPRPAAERRSPIADGGPPAGARAGAGGRADGTQRARPPSGTGGSAPPRRGARGPEARRPAARARRHRLDRAPVVAGRDRERVDAVHDPLVVGRGAIR